jgi:hypothetical protein
VVQRKALVERAARQIRSVKFTRLLCASKRARASDTAKYASGQVKNRELPPSPEEGSSRTRVRETR